MCIVSYFFIFKIVPRYPCKLLVNAIQTDCSIYEGTWCRSTKSGAQSVGAQSVGAQKVGAQSMGAQSMGAQSIGAQSMGRKVLGRKVWRRKVWGAKYGGAKCGGAKCGAQSVGAQSVGRKILGAQSVGAQSVGRKVWGRKVGITAMMRSQKSHLAIAHRLVFSTNGEHQKYINMFYILLCAFIVINFMLTDRS